MISFADITVCIQHHDRLAFSSGSNVDTREPFAHGDGIYDFKNDLQVTDTSVASHLTDIKVSNEKLSGL